MDGNKIIIIICCQGGGWVEPGNVFSYIRLILFGHVRVTMDTSMCSLDQ